MKVKIVTVQSYEVNLTENRNNEAVIAENARPEDGIQSLYCHVVNYLSDHYFRIQSELKKAKRVYISYVVDADQSLHSFQLVKGKEDSLSQLVMEAIQSYSGKWIPARNKDGQSTRQVMYAPLQFTP